MAEIQKVSAKIGADASQYKKEINDAASVTSNFGKVAKKTKQEVDYFGNGLHDLAKKKGAPVHPYFQQLSKTTEANAVSWTKLAKSAGVVGGVLAATGVAAWKIVEPLVEAREQANDLSRQLGTTPEFIERFTVAAGSLKISAEDAGDAISDFAEKLGKAQIEDTDLEKFQLVGLSLEDVKKSDPSDVLIKALGNINKLGTAAQRQSAAVELFGDKGKDLLKISELGEQGIRNLLNSTEVSTVGPALDNINSSLLEITTSAKAVGKAIGEYLVPVVDWLLSSTLAISKGFGDLVGTIAGGGGLSDVQWSSTLPKPVEEERKTISLKSVEKMNDAAKANEENLKKLGSLQREVNSLSDKNATLWHRISEEFKDSNEYVKQMAFNLDKVKDATSTIEGLRSSSVGGADDAALAQMNDLRKFSDITAKEFEYLKIQADNALKSGLGGSLNPNDVRRERLAQIDSDLYLSGEEKGTARKNADRAFIAEQRSFLEGLGKVFTPLEDVGVKLEELLFQREQGNVTGDQFKAILGDLANQRAKERDSNRLAETYIGGSTSAYERIARFQSGIDRSNYQATTARNTEDLVEEVRGLRRDLASQVTEALETL